MDARTCTLFKNDVEVCVMEDLPEEVAFGACFGGSNQFLTLLDASTPTTSYNDMALACAYKTNQLTGQNVSQFDKQYTSSFFNREVKSSHLCFLEKRFRMFARRLVPRLLPTTARHRGDKRGWSALFNAFVNTLSNVESERIASLLAENPSRSKRVQITTAKVTKADSSKPSSAPASGGAVVPKSTLNGPRRSSFKVKGNRVVPFEIEGPKQFLSPTPAQVVDPYDVSVALPGKLAKRKSGYTQIADVDEEHRLTAQDITDKTTGGTSKSLSIAVQVCVLLQRKASAVASPELLSVALQGVLHIVRVALERFDVENMKDKKDIQQYSEIRNDLSSCLNVHQLLAGVLLFVEYSNEAHRRFLRPLFELALVLLHGGNKTVQKDFLSVFKSTPAALKSLVSLLSDMSVHFEGSKGADRVKVSADLVLVMEFIQLLGENQFTEMQNLLRETLVLKQILHAAQMVATSSPVICEWLTYEERVSIYRLGGRICASFVDLIQGPNLENLRVLLSSNLLNILSQYLQQVSREETGLGHVSAENAVLFLSLQELESASISLFFSLIEETSERDIFVAVLRGMDLQLFARQFSTRWQSSQFEKRKLEKVIALISQHDNKIARLQHRLQKKHLRNKPERDRKNSIVHRRKSVVGEALVVPTENKTATEQTSHDLTKDDADDDVEYMTSTQLEQAVVSYTLRVTELRKQKSFLTLVASRTKQMRAKDIEIAFAYFESFEHLRDKLLPYKEEEEVKDKFIELQNLWDPVREDKHLAKYFGSVEIIGPNQDIQRRFFLIPEACRSQHKEGLVYAMRNTIVDSVNRDSAEEKLNDFLDRSAVLIDLIQHQHRLLNSSRWSKPLQWFLRHETMWIALTYMLALTINIVMIFTLDSNYPASDLFLPEIDGWYSDVGSFNYKRLITLLSILHLSFSCLFVLNYYMYTLPSLWAQIGRAAEHADKGEAESDAQGALPSFVARIANTTTRFARRIWQLLSRSWALYYVLYLLFSLLGLLVSPFFFAFHLIDVVPRVKLLRYVITAVTQNAGQLASTAFLWVLVMWFYTIGAFNSYQSEFTFGDGSLDCTTMATCWSGVVNYGIRGAPVWDDGILLDFGKYFFGISYHIVVILILVTIVTGIIIDTFGELRGNSNERIEDTLNRCFICHHPRELFERHNISFEKHIKRDHMMWNYVYFIVYLKSKNRMELSLTERHVLNLFVTSDVSMFPIKRALAIESRVEQNDFEALNSRLDNFEHSIRDIVGGLVKQNTKLHEDLAELTRSLGSMRTPGTRSNSTAAENVESRKYSA
eukprot:GILK01009255.1.p1 GENE.GILK01009255.1~~GILK01009255.1.p1  ORF type:complete len:1334 (-),score=217.51 GILK01009255.1:107-3976(-)